MLRLLIALLLGGAVFVLVAWNLGYLQTDTQGDVPPKPEDVKKVNLGGDLYPPVPWPKTAAPVTKRAVDPVVVVGNMAVIDRPDIPAQVPGQLMFIGEEVPEGAAQVAGAAAFIAEPYDFTKVNHGARDVIKLYRRLYEGQIVYEDQILAMVDTAKSLGDLDMKRGKIVAALADMRGAKAIAQEAEAKYLTAEELKRRNAISLEEYRSAVLTRDKMYQDSVAKEEAWKLAQIEENVSRIIYKQHEIRNKVPVRRSVIQKLYKQRGDGVKELEPVMQLNSLDRLMAEAQIDQQYSRRLYDGMRVTIEPTVVEAPRKTYRGHTSAVNCLAVTHDPVDPLIVSGGEDRTVLVWNRLNLGPVREFRHPEAVKALACSPVGANRNLVLTGCADGYVRLFNLDAQESALLKEAKEHAVAVTAVAFSADGKYFASGAADGTIIVWTTDKGEVLYVLDEEHGVTDPHHGAITELHFTPQSKLVSAGMDNNIHVWSLKEKGAVLDYEPLGGRSGSVALLDVSADGSVLLFDQGKTLQIRAVADGRMVNTLQNPGGVIPFDTVALFSPDASMLLTAGVGEGRLQLWRAPEGTTRGFEIRQFASRETAPVACAAFAPRADYNKDGSFAVSANKDGQIHLWPLPSPKTVEDHPIRDVRVRLISNSLNPSTRQVSIGVEVPNPPTESHPKGRLEPGRPVTIVID